MALRFCLLLLATLVVLVVIVSTEARQEIKVQDGGESSDPAEADVSDEKRKKQKNEQKPGTTKVRTKQKWQRFETPSSAKMKKPSSCKGKTARKCGKAGVEQKVERSAEYTKRDGRKKDKWVKHKQRTEDPEEGLIRGEAKEIDAKKWKKHRDGTKVTEKSKSEKDTDVCFKDGECSSDKGKNKEGGKNVWKEKHSNGGWKEGAAVQSEEAESHEETRKTAQEDVANGGADAEEGRNEQDGRRTAKQKKGGDGHKGTDDNARKKKKKVVALEAEQMGAEKNDVPEAKVSKSKGGKIRRYVVEEEVLEEEASEDAELLSLVQ